MKSIPFAEIRARANILDVWRALGGGELKKNRRGQAFWRQGDGFNIHLDPQNGLWFDFVNQEGGDVITLVRTARQVDWQQAVQWLLDYLGLKPSGKSPHGKDSNDLYRRDLKWARWWRIGMQAFCEEWLERLPAETMVRATFTEVLRVINLSDTTLVDEYRAWRESDSAMTEAMCYAGRKFTAGQQAKLVELITQKAQDAQQ
jgi:hypothetical protein